MTAAVFAAELLRMLTVHAAAISWVKVWVHMQSLLRANLLAASKPDLGCEILNIGPDTPLTNRDIVAAQHDPYAVIEKYWPGSARFYRDHDLTLSANSFWPPSRNSLESDACSFWATMPRF